MTSLSCFSIEFRLGFRTEAKDFIATKSWKLNRFHILSIHIIDINIHSLRDKAYKLALGKDLSVSAVPIKNTWNRYGRIRNTSPGRTDAINPVSPVYVGV